MINWLYSLPEIVVIGLSSAFLVALMTALPRLVQRLPFLAPSDANTDFVVRVQATLFTMNSLMLAFTLVEADGNFRRVDSLISGEASQIDRLDRLLTRYGDPAALELRAHLRTYTQSIIDDDWPRMMHGNESEKTRQAFIPISRGVLGLNPSSDRQREIYSGILRAFDAVAEARDMRLNAAGDGLPRIYWIVVLFAATMLLLVSSTMQATRFRAIILGCQAAVLGAFIGFVFVMDQPFKGETSVSTDHYVRALKHMNGRPNPSP
jgi:hypothetical protein